MGPLAERQGNPQRRDGEPGCLPDPHPAAFHPRLWGATDGAGLPPGAQRSRGRLSITVSLGMLPASLMNPELLHINLAIPTPKPGCSLTAAVSSLPSFLRSLF